MMLSGDMQSKFEVYAYFLLCSVCGPYMLYQLWQMRKASGKNSTLCNTTDITQNHVTFRM